LLIPARAGVFEADFVTFGVVAIGLLLKDRVAFVLGASAFLAAGDVGEGAAWSGVGEAGEAGSVSSVSAEEPKVGVAVLHSGEDPVGVGEAGFERRLQHFVEKISKRPGPIVPLSKNGRHFGKIQRWQIACVNGLPDMTTTRCVRRDL